MLTKLEYYIQENTLQNKVEIKTLQTNENMIAVDCTKILVRIVPLTKKMVDLFFKDRLIQVVNKIR